MARERREDLEMEEDLARFEAGQVDRMRKDLIVSIYTGQDTRNH